MYTETTNAITITVHPVYLDEQSAPADNHYVWAYHIHIENHSDKTVQLRSRHWQITDAQGQIHEVRGSGVVGEQPVLRPGDHFNYTSGVPLSTPSGFMTGSYAMTSDTGEDFAVRIPVFSLDSPYQPASVH